MKITLTRKKIVLISFVVILLLIVIKVGHFFYQEDIRWHGRDFATREKMCFQFAVDYLNNIEKDPNFTEDKRKLLVKDLKKFGEDAKVSLRGARRDQIEAIKKSEKDKLVSEDESKKLQTEVQNLIDKYVKQIDDLVTAKEKDIMTV